MDNKCNFAVIALMFLPVIFAVCSLVADFQLFDLTYLIFVGILFRNYKAIKK